MSGITHSSGHLQIPLEKGYSQMDWMRLTRTHPDLAGTHKQTVHSAADAARKSRALLLPLHAGGVSARKRAMMQG